MVDTSEINLKEHKIFFVGGEDYLVNNKTVIRGQMYVESFKPIKSNNKNIIIYFCLLLKVYCIF